MSDRTKKVLLVILFIAIALLLGLAIYFLFFRPLLPQPTPPVTPVTPTPPTGFPPTQPPTAYVPPLINAPALVPPALPSIPPTPTIPGAAISFQANGGLTAYTVLESDPAISPSLSSNGTDLVYYNANNGFFYNITPDGTKTLISDVAFKNVEKVTWAPNSKQAVMEYPDGSNVIYDINKKTTITLPTHWKDFTFSPDSSKIAFKAMKLDPEDRYIAVSDINGGNYRQIEPMGDEDENVTVTWAPNNQYVALFIKGLDADRSEIYPIGFNGENFKAVRVEGRDPRYVFSPTGNKLLYSSYNSSSSYNPTLWVVNSTPDLLGTGRTKLDLDTWADKCTFGGDNTIYCAVPKTLDMGSGFIPSMADSQPDNIYKISLLNGTKELIAQPLFDTSIGKMVVSQDKSILYVWDKNSGQIKEIRL
ncbi:MAG: hypothetical protein NTX82_04775 [Candidatus Parcubacteria bacterium]|nr:hypothetical protein [Candidatus Parcubacteria bacterium]